MFFITGPNVVGKSTLIPHLAALLPKGEYDVRDFDERGVPEDARTAWRVTETANWKEEGLRAASAGNHLVVCGFVKPDDFMANGMHVGRDVDVIHFDASSDVLRKRLEKRYSKNGAYDPSQTVIGKPVEVFIAGNLYIRESLRKEYEAAGAMVIDTSAMRPEDVAAEVANAIADSGTRKIA